MRTTTVSDLTTALTSAIRQITPSSTELQSRGWRPVDDYDQVQGGEIRTFYVEILDVAPVDDGIYSPSAIEHGGLCLVHTSYGNLRRSVFRGLSAEDGRQVGVVIAVRSDAFTDNTIAGLVSFVHQGWQDEDTEQGRQWGAHLYAVRFLAAGVPS